MTATPSASPKAEPRMQVPLLDLKAQYRALKAQILPVVEAVLESQQLINGPDVKALEDEVAKFTQTRACIGMSSGTDALVCALMSLGIGPGDEVITSPYTFFATAGSIWRVGAKPVFVDIDPRTFNIDATKIRAAVTPRTKAIMPVYLFGQTADMDAIMAIASEHKLFVIEDAAQALGATYKGKPAGSIGTVGCYSFFPSKNLGGAGDGGAIVTNDPQLAERITVFRNHGSKPKYFHKFVGGNFRLDTIQAAYLRIKLPHLNAWSVKRQQNAALYDRLLADCKQITRPLVLPGNGGIYNQYCIRAQRRDQLKNYLQEQGIGTEVYYPLSLHEQECFKSLGHKRGDFPESERAAAESLAIPIYPELATAQIEYVADRIKSFYA